MLSGSIVPAGIAGLCECVRLLLQERDAAVIVCDVGRLVHPDAVTVDALARLRLTARRLGYTFRLRGECGELEDLLDLMGLRDVIAVGAELRVEPGRETEEREQVLGVEEEGDPAEPIA